MAFQAYKAVPISKELPVIRNSLLLLSSVDVFLSAECKIRKLRKTNRQTQHCHICIVSYYTFRLCIKPTSDEKVLTKRYLYSSYVRVETSTCNVIIMSQNYYLQAETCSTPSKVLLFSILVQCMNPTLLVLHFFRNGDCKIL